LSCAFGSPQDQRKSQQLLNEQKKLIKGIGTAKHVEYLESLKGFIRTKAAPALFWLPSK
jgi:hypothetical protein